MIKRQKNRQHNDQKKKYKRIKNDLQNITHKTKDSVTGTPLYSFLYIIELVPVLNITEIPLAERYNYQTQHYIASTQLDN
jgi:hypothetical protein